MATFKHISSKNADYGAAEAYLTFEHDEFTMKPTLDENGRLIPREDYRISSLNCGGEDFAVACMRANLRYEKNQKREDVKSHHYIISFDPRDGTDNGLTVDRAQELGEQFCKEHFPGHQALICTHPDGHNHSGNIHVHIVINSLRIYEVPLLPYMDRPADTREGCKHRCTNAAMEYFKSEVMEMCHREGLYQIDLLNGSKERITEREYWAAKKGQLALDKENAAREAAGQPTKPTKFETDKAKLRRTIRQALSQAGSFDEFSSLLLREGVTVKESRGRLSYLTPDRTKPITARKLGDDFDKAAVLALLTQNAHRAAEQTTAIPEYPHTQKGRLQEEKTTKTTPADNTLQRMVDREAKRAEGKGVDIVPTVHEGAAVRQMEKRGIQTNIGNLNREIRAANRLMKSIRQLIQNLKGWITELGEKRKELLAQKAAEEATLLPNLLMKYMEIRKEERKDWTRAGQNRGTSQDLKAVSEALSYLRQKGLSTVEDLEAFLESSGKSAADYRNQMKPKEARSKVIDGILASRTDCKECKPVYEKYQKIFFKKTKEKFKQEHPEVARYAKAAAYLAKHPDDKDSTQKELQEEQEKLVGEIAGLKEPLTEVQEDLKKLRDIRYWVRKATPGTEESKEPPKKQPIKEVLQDKADEKKAQRTAPAQAKHRQQDMEL